MNKWPLSFVRRNSHLFLADNSTQDDPFLLYAALKSGTKTNIFSRDLMRSHSTLLDNESKKLFRRWQQQHQFSLITTLQYNDILVREPVAFDVRAQKINSHWHIPFTEEKINFSYDTFEMPSKWLCTKID
jgi:mitochondrial ribonuclease P protein 3